MAPVDGLKLINVVLEITPLALLALLLPAASECVLMSECLDGRGRCVTCAQGGGLIREGR